MSAEDYCRELEAYLCRKNDGHLIRIVGPAFEQVSRWAADGIPLKVACAGVDRYFERYYRKGRRRWPVRIEFCEADVRDAFDDWRRIVGVQATAAADAEDEAQPARGSRSISLASHVERAIARLTALRSSASDAAALSDALDRAIRALDGLQADARRRGPARQSLLQTLATLDRELSEAALAALPEAEQTRVRAEAEQELAPFRARMERDVYDQSCRAAAMRLVRERFGLPRIAFE